MVKGVRMKKYIGPFILFLFLVILLIGYLDGQKEKNNKIVTTLNENITPNELTKDDDILFYMFLEDNEEKRNKTNLCEYPYLVVYSNGTYELYNEHKIGPIFPKYNTAYWGTYSNSIKGTYEYDIMKIIAASKYSPEELDEYEYEIMTSKGNYYVEKGTTNPYLETFLKQIKAKPHKCVKNTFYERDIMIFITLLIFLITFIVVLRNIQKDRKKVPRKN